MSLKNSVVLFFFIFFISVFTSYAQPAVSSAVQEGRQLVMELMQGDNIPGLSVSVSKNGELVWSEGFGYADLEQKVPVYPDKTKFRIGSVSKPLTAMALALLYEDDKIDLDVAVQKYAPTFPEKKYPITLRQLAGHLGGIRHYKGMEFLSNRHYSNVTDGLDVFKNDPLLHPPGSQYAYSSYGWNLISVAIENAAGEPFLDFMAEKVFSAMDMKETYADQVYDLIPYRSRFYARQDGKIKNAAAVDNSYKWAGGGFISTSEDLIRFGEALLNNSLIKKETLEEFIASQETSDGKKTNYGIGFRSGKDDGGKAWFGHSGGSVGGITQFVVYPEEKIIVAIVTNSSNVNYGKLPYKLANLF